jgi:hypothetical protein
MSFFSLPLLVLPFLALPSGGAYERYGSSVSFMVAMIPGWC